MNKKQKIIFGLVSLVLFIAAAAIMQAKIIPDGARLDVTLISQEPDPAEPGEIMDLRFKVENIGGAAAEDIVFEFIEEYPFSVYASDTQKEIGSLQGRQKAEEGIIVLYKIKVDENAVERTYYIDVRYKYGRYGEWMIVRDFPIRVRTRDLVLSVESIKSTPALISPGDDFELSLTLRNNADSLIRDVRVKLDLSEDDTPFAPSNSIAEKQIYQINSKTGKIMTFDLVALPDAEGGIYKIPITISYADETGQSYSKEDMISLKVSATSDLLVTIDSSEIKEKIKSGEVVIKIVNRGLTNIKLLSAKLLESKSIEILSEPEVYVGNIDSDDYETVEFKITAKSYEKSIELPLELNYKDSTNKQLKQKITLNLKTYSQGIVSSIISRIINGIIIIAVIVGVGLGIRWLYLRRKRKRKG